MVAHALWDKACAENKSILFYVHGYKNDVVSLAESCEKLEKLYNVIVVGFSWPTNARTLDYLDDKRDARVSASALERTIERAGDYVERFNQAGLARLEKFVKEKYPDDGEAQMRLFNRKLPDVCRVKLNLLCHSMGNYLYKYALISSLTQANPLLFSNIVLVAADVNNDGHEKWVDQLRVREDVYITINEDDFALKASRLKFGAQQKARLGHYRKNLHSNQAVYVDFTDAVGDSHSYFVDEHAEKDTKTWFFFNKVLNGEQPFSDKGETRRFYAVDEVV